MDGIIVKEESGESNSSRLLRLLLLGLNKLLPLVGVYEKILEL